MSVPTLQAHYEGQIDEQSIQSSWSQIQQSEPQWTLCYLLPSVHTTDRSKDQLLFYC